MNSVFLKMEATEKSSVKMVLIGDGAVGKTSLFLGVLEIHSLEDISQQTIIQLKCNVKIDGKSRTLDVHSRLPLDVVRLSATR